MNLQVQVIVGGGCGRELHYQLYASSLAINLPLGGMIKCIGVHKENLWAFEKFHE